MFLSELSMLLLLVYGATCIDVSLKKRIPRRNTELTRTFNLNRPSLMEIYDLSPVTVVYEDHFENPSAMKRATNFNGSATRVNTNVEEDRLDKPKPRSTKITGSENPEINYIDLGGIPRPKTLRRRSQVRKVKVDKSQLDAYLNKTGNVVNQKEETNININRTDISDDSKQIPKRGQTFQKRKQLRDAVIPIIESESYVFSHSGNFHYSYEGGDGTKAYERGELKTSNGGAGSAVEGNFSYTDKDGNDFSLSYTADENGYRPVGAHLPTPPPIPPAIQRALDLLATKTTPEPITERVKTL